jgi:hypothetical protein
MTSITRESVIAERLRRQGLLEPAKTREEYQTLFRRLQPVSTAYFAMPGSPPTLVHRAAFDDYQLCSQWREKRKIIKGRFLRGTIGYVFSDDLSLCANAFQRPMEKVSRNHELVFSVLQHVGPLTPRQIKEETGLLNKEIMPILHRLQEAFLVYEDQVDTDWERAWYVFANEWADVIVSPDHWQDAAQEVLRRFLEAHVFATIEQIRDWSGWPAKEIKRLLDADGQFVSQAIDGFGEGWTLAKDTSFDMPELPDSVFMLHKADPLVQAATSELKRRFAGLEVLQYLLIDGEWQGAVCGHWRIGPHDVEDIVIDLPERERIARRDEIMDAIAWRYHPPSHHILRYNREPVVG